MKNYKILVLSLLIVPIMAFTQEKENDSIADKPERPAFEGSAIIDNQTNELFIKNTLEVMMQHRFGKISEDNSLAGIYGSNSNIRLALSYSILDWLSVGYGITKKNITSDFNLKAAILRQTRSGSMPISLTYYGNVAIDGRNEDVKNPDGSYKPADAEAGIFLTDQDRLSYFHQLIIAKRFNSKLSLQIAPSLSHFNAVNYSNENDRFSIAFGGRYKISNQTAIIFDYSQPITDFSGTDYNNYPGISLGAEFATSGHAFQIFITNYNGIVPQQNYMKNTNDFFDKGILIGFNINRKYNF